uniref:MARVEL domain-containing protein n=1 Tax=Romanomermis culicivorax TaxID=13658 RepID=A0A915IS16_ROMCU
MSTSEETAKAYARSKAGILRIVELIIAIIISIVISFYHEGLRQNYIWAFIIYWCMVACVIMIIVSLVMHCCGKECPCILSLVNGGLFVYDAWSGRD